MVYTKTDKAADKILKIIRESKMLLMEDETTESGQQSVADDVNKAQQQDKIELQDKPESQESDISNIPIPINDNTFPGILANEEEKISQKLNVKFEENPFIYNPSNQTVSFTGILPNMSNLRFYYTNDVSTSLSDGCFIFATGMVLNEESLKNLSIIKSHFEIFSNEWSPSAIKEKLSISKQKLKRFQEEYAGMKFFKI
jgi:hypothetical protein